MIKKINLLLLLGCGLIMFPQVEGANSNNQSSWWNSVKNKAQSSFETATNFFRGNNQPLSGNNTLKNFFEERAKDFKANPNYSPPIQNIAQPDTDSMKNNNQLSLNIPNQVNQYYSSPTQDVSNSSMRNNNPSSLNIVNQANEHHHNHSDDSNDWKNHYGQDHWVNKPYDRNSSIDIRKMINAYYFIKIKLINTRESFIYYDKAIKIIDNPDEYVVGFPNDPNDRNNNYNQEKQDCQIIKKLTDQEKNFLLNVLMVSHCLLCNQHITGTVIGFVERNNIAKLIENDEILRVELYPNSILFVPNYWYVYVKSVEKSVIEKVQYKTILNEINFLHDKYLS
jgi:hypothetical protein